MANPLSVELAPSGARAADGQGEAVDIGALRSAARLVLTVTAFAGGDDRQLDLRVETSPDGLTGWREVAAFAPVTELAELELYAAGLQRFVRATWLVAGAGVSFTFGVKAEAHVVYASPARLRRLGIHGGALDGVPDGALAEYCIVASVESDGYLAVGWQLPLTGWSDDLTIFNAKIAVYHYLDATGRQPTGPDDLIDRGYAQAVKWLRGVGSGAIDPPGMQDSTPEVQEMGFVVETDEQRGW